MFKGFSFKYAISIIIGYVTLFFSPAIYLGLTSGNGWWPLFASIVVGFVQIIATSIISGLIPVSISSTHPMIILFCQMEKPKMNISHTALLLEMSIIPQF